MSEYNYFQNFYNKNDKNYKTSGFHVDNYFKGRNPGKNIPSDRQFQYHKALTAFLEGKGLETSNFLKPRSAQMCRSNINAMLTIIKKNGWYDEFQERRIFE